MHTNILHGHAHVHIQDTQKSKRARTRAHTDTRERTHVHRATQAVADTHTPGRSDTHPLQTSLSCPVLPTPDQSPLLPQCLLHPRSRSAATSPGCGAGAGYGAAVASAAGARQCWGELRARWEVGPWPDTQVRLQQAGLGPWARAQYCPSLGCVGSHRSRLAPSSLTRSDSDSSSSAAAALSSAHPLAAAPPPRPD